MTTDGVEIPFAAPGAAELGQVIARLATVLETLSAAQRDNTQAENENTGATQQNAQAKSQATQQAIAFDQRLAGVANAVQSLTSQLGGGSHAAGLIGAIANTSVQFAQMGAALGPQGAIVGGIVGALVPALHELIESQDSAAQSARHLIEVQQQLSEIRRAQTAERLASVEREIESGHIETLSLTEIADQRLLVEDRIRSYQNSLEQLAIAERQETERGDHTRLGDEARARTVATLNGQMLHQIQILGQLGTLEARRLAENGQATVAGVSAPTSPPVRARSGGGPTADQRADQRLASLRAAIDELEQSPVLDGSLDSQLHEQISQVEEAYTSAWNAAYDGASNYLDLQSQLIDQVRALGQAESEEASAQHEREEQAARDTEERARLLSKTKEDARRQDAEIDQERHKRIQAALRDEEQTKNKLRQESQARQQEGQQATGAIIGDLTNVFSLMAEGQMNAAQGAEMLLASFLNYISQRATIEALAQVAQGIGSYPDFGGMALHFAAAAAWAAVAVATGVGGAALASDAQGKASAAQSEASKPASPSHSGSNGGDQGSGSGTIIVQFNSPIITTSSVAQTGRAISRMVEIGQRRYNRG